MNYATIDLETTGLDRTKVDPIQLAYLISDEKKQLERGSFYMKTDQEIDEGAFAAHGIGKHTLNARGISQEAGAKRYNALIWRHQPITLIGYNIINFDFPIIQNWLSRNISGPFKSPPVMAIVDVMLLFCKKFNQRKWPKLSDAADRLNIDFDINELHDALADVELTWKIFLELGD